MLRKMELEVAKSSVAGWERKGFARVERSGRSSGASAADGAVRPSGSRERVVFSGAEKFGQR